MTSMEPHNRVRWVYSSNSDQELEERYDQWAQEYDRDLDVEFGWISPRMASEFLAKHCSPSGLVLDAGAGTGLVGEILAAKGFDNLVAMDLSQGMLDEAAKKGVYKEFHKMALGQNLEYGDDHFDAVIVVGVFTAGHAPASSLDELVRITKPGGHIAFTIRNETYEENGFRERQEGLAAQNKWKVAEVSDEYQPLPKGEPEVVHRVWVYEVV